MPGILIVEDDLFIRETLAELLRLEGYDVSCAINGEDALARLSDEPACLILLDLMMPIMDGWEFRRRQQQAPALAAIPFILMSGVEDEAKRSIAGEAVGSFRKPLDIDAVLETIERHCPRAAPI
jgi:CheY-like chemotaxis protein